jgi:hypothetical protein
MPRQTVTTSFAFLAPMFDWKIKETINGEPQDDLFGMGGDAFAAARDADDSHLIKSYLLPLTCCRQIFYVITPFVAMNDSFPAIEEEELTVYKLTPTLDFTLSLKLNFHGEHRKSTQMFEKHGLGNIRFLNELKVCGRVDENDFLQIAKLGFLQELDLSRVSHLPDESLKSLHGMVNLRKLNISLWKRLTAAGVAEIPTIAPHLEHLVLVNNARRGDNFFNGLVTSSESFCRSLKHFHIGEFRTPGFSNLYSNWFPPFGNDVMDVISKFVNLRSLQLDGFITTSIPAFRQIAINCQRLVSLEIDHTHTTANRGNWFSLRHLKIICKYMGERLESLAIGCSIAPWKKMLYWIANKLVALRKLKIKAFYFLDNELKYQYELSEEAKQKKTQFPPRDAHGYWTGKVLHNFLEDVRVKAIKLSDRVCNDAYLSNVNGCYDDGSTDCNSEFDEN